MEIYKQENAKIVQIHALNAKIASVIA